MNRVINLAILATFLTTLSNISNIRPEEDTGLDVNVDIEVTSSIISVNNISISEYGSVYLLLSSKKLTLDYSQFFKNNKDTEENLLDSVVRVTQPEKATNFTDLQRNTTYHLYYFAKSHISQKISEVNSKEVTTALHKPAFVRSNNPASVSHQIDQFFTIFVPIVFMVSIFLFFKKLDEETMLETITDDCSTYCNSEKLNVSYTDNIAVESNTGIFDWCKQTSLRLFKASSKEEIDVPQSQDELLSLNKVLEMQNKEYRDNQLCGICCENPRSVVFLGCGHIFCCYKCSMKLKICPIDQKPITKKCQYQICDIYGIAEHPKLKETEQTYNNAMENALNKCRFLSFIFRSNILAATQEKYRRLFSINKKQKKYFTCIGCNKNSKDVLFSDCCHLIYCNSCSSKTKICPIDGRYITEKHKVFIS